MRILFTSISDLDHVQPLVPLARTLSERGNDVCWATGPDGCSWLRACGIVAVEAGANAADERAEYRRRWPEWTALSGLDLQAHRFPRLFGEVAAAGRVTDLFDVVGTFRPELVISETAEFAGPIAAAKADVPHVTHAIGPAVPRQRLEATVDALAPLWAAAALAARPHGGQFDRLFIDIYPPSMQSTDLGDVGPTVHRRPMLADAVPGEQLPDGIGQLLRLHPSRPTISLSFGGDEMMPADAREALQAVAGFDANVIASLGRHVDLAAFADIAGHGGNVRIHRQVPQSLLLPYCTAVVSPGGSSIVLAALARGLPQMCVVPVAAEAVNALAVTAAGAGVALHLPNASADSIAAGVARLLTNASYRIAAARVRDEIAMMPSADEVATILERL